jgi:hypothetical protein
MRLERHLPGRRTFHEFIEMGRAAGLIEHHSFEEQGRAVAEGILAPL